MVVFVAVPGYCLTASPKPNTQDNTSWSEVSLMVSQSLGINDFKSDIWKVLTPGHDAKLSSASILAK